ncbi:MAG: DNA primase [Gammaproteobacteria bacterium]|nr:DNA primase [Gammaproteobacteria bacterium]
MSFKIPRSFIDQLLAKVDIVSLIGGSFSLKKAGKSWVACCPFHQEKTPSFTVSPDKQFYHCFGCGAHGNAISFLIAYEKMDFMEALKTLAHQQGMTLPSGGGEKENKDESTGLFEILEKVVRYYHQVLLKSEQAIFARQYLRERGLTLAILKTFEIGFAPPGWNTLSEQFSIDKKQTERWIQAGLLIQKDLDHTYDRFRNRIMFPIRDRKGYPIGFGGRVLTADEKPKYLNSPETPIFHKGYELYGLYSIVHKRERPSYLLVVEGYMDVIALVQQGITSSVATLGTALTKEHLELLFRYAPVVVFCFDGDSAGQMAAARALDVALPFLGNPHEIRFMVLPQNEDPDTWVRKIGKDSFEKHIKTAKPLATFLVESVSGACDLTQVDGQIKLIQLIKSKLEKTSDLMIRYPILQEVSRKTHIECSVLEKALEHTTEGTLPSFSTVSLSPPTPLVKKTIQLLLQFPVLAQKVEGAERLKGIQLPGIALLLHILERLQHSPSLSFAALFEDLRETDYEKQISQLIPLQTTLSEGEAGLELKGALKKLLAVKKQQNVEDLLQKSRTQPLSSEEKTRLQALLVSS